MHATAQNAASLLIWRHAKKQQLSAVVNAPSNEPDPDNKWLDWVWTAGSEEAAFDAQKSLRLDP